MPRHGTHNMDAEREQRKHWFRGRRIARSPPPYPSRQLAPLSSDRSSGRQHRSRERRQAPADRRCDSRGRYALPYTQDQQQSGTSSRRTPPTNGHKRPSSPDERERYHHEEGDARGRDTRPPPTRRRRITPEAENSLDTCVGGSLSVEVQTIGRQASRSPSPLSDRTVQEGSRGYKRDDRRRGRDYTSSSRRRQRPSDRSLSGNRGDRRGRVDRHESVGRRGERRRGQPYPSSRPHHRDASKPRGDSHRHKAQERPMEGPWNDAQSRRGSDQSQSYGTTNNIGNADSIFTGTNHGVVNMGSTNTKL
ncbi:hypothetical protein BKA70DRAFT_1565713, partial [Coprinopsis sp. MPI-PUGE-AT-0042]